MVKNVLVNAKFFLNHATTILKANKTKAALLIAPKLLTIPLLSLGSELPLVDDVKEMFNNISTTVNEKMTSYKPDSEIETADMLIGFEDAINVTLGDINKLGIIVNDGDCSDNYIESVCQALDDAGVVYTFSRNGDNVNHDNSVVITLDQQYSAGDKSVFIAPFDNNNYNNSDALAIAMKSSFDNAGIANNGIYCGKRGYSESNGIINTRVPTDTEKAINPQFNTSFVNICFGTDTPDAQLVSECITNALGRFCAYKAEKNSVPLLYRAEQGDLYSNVANKFGVSPYELSGYDGNNSEIINDTTIINPNIPGTLKNSNVNVLSEVRNNQLT